MQPVKPLKARFASCQAHLKTGLRMDKEQLDSKKISPQISGREGALPEWWRTVTALLSLKLLSSDVSRGTCHSSLTAPVPSIWAPSLAGRWHASSRLGVCSPLEDPGRQTKSPLCKELSDSNTEPIAVRII